MAKIYASIYKVETVTCIYCKGSTRMLTPINGTKSNIISKCIYCENGVMTIEYTDDIPVNLDKIDTEETR